MPVNEQTMTLLRRRAEELADAAPPLTAEQAPVSAFAKGEGMALAEVALELPS